MHLCQIHPSIDVPDSVEVGADGEVTVPVRVTLENHTDGAVVVASPAGDDPHFVHVLNEQQREVCRNREVSAEAEQHVSLTVSPEHPVHRQFEVNVDCGKLRDGRRYTVRAVLYGHAAEDSFVAIKPPQPKAPAKKAKKKAAKKKSSR